MISIQGERTWHLLVRVRYPDGRTADVTCDFRALTSHSIGDAVNSVQPYPMSPGVVVPVRFDPANPTNVCH